MSRDLAEAPEFGYSGSPASVNAQLSSLPPRARSPLSPAAILIASRFCCPRRQQVRCRPSYPGLPNPSHPRAASAFVRPRPCTCATCLGDIPIAAISGQRAAARFDFNGTCSVLAARYAPRGSFVANQQPDALRKQQRRRPRAVRLAHHPDMQLSAARGKTAECAAKHTRGAGAAASPASPRHARDRPCQEAPPSAWRAGLHAGVVSARRVSRHLSPLRQARRSRHQLRPRRVSPSEPCGLACSAGGEWASARWCG